jgi:DNA-binding CsgD family transcriptional regulator
MALAQIGQDFELTRREKETVELLIQGLTSKEIATRMQISPNTVKAFLRIVMVKMGVSTRSGILGKVIGPRM